MALGFGIIGCGMIAGFHARAIADISGAKLVACQSRRMEAAEEFARDNGGTAYESVAELLADPAVDVVTICTPSGAHLDPAVAAAKAGKHVIVEKPLEITLDRCDQIIDACIANNVTLSTIFPSRFHDSSQLLKAAIDEGRFGTLTLGDAYVKWFRTQEYYDSGQWRDLLTWLMGPVVEISAQTATLAHERIEVEDVATASLKFANGALGVIEASTAAFPGMLKKIEIHGNQGSVVIEEEDIKTWTFAEMTAKDEEISQKYAAITDTGGGAADPAAIGHAAHAKQFKDVIEAIENGKPLAVDGAEGRRSVEIILAIYKAAETGKTIQLPLTSDPVLEAKKNA